MSEVSWDFKPLFDPIIVNFYKEIAQRVGMYEEDFSSIFNISTGKPIVLEKQPTQLSFFLEDKYDTAFDCTMAGNTMLLFAESQRNKTTSLLSIATLLGYSWDDQNNMHFLSDEEFVKKGKSRREFLTHGQKSSLKIIRGKRTLEIKTSGGEATILFSTENMKDIKTFDLYRYWTAFEKYMNQLVDVQLVSKGRSFIERVESEILNDFKILAQTLIKNCEKESTRLTVQRTRPTNIAVQTDERNLNREVDRIKNGLREIENSKKQYLRQLAAIQHIAALRSQLSDSDFQAIEKIYSLISNLETAEETEKEKLAHRQNLQQKEVQIQRIRTEYQRLSEQQNALNIALSVLQDDVIVLFSKSIISKSREMENLLASIEMYDVQSICNTIDGSITLESLKVYDSLIRSLEEYGSLIIPLLPLGDKIRTSTDLLMQVRNDLEKATNLVHINEAISKFKRSLQDAGIDQRITALNYREQTNGISKYKLELDLLETELEAEQETLTSKIGEQNTDLLRSQIKQAKETLSPKALETREAIEEEVKSLEELSNVQLERVWASNAISYLKDLERQVDEVLRSLRKEQLRLEREREQDEIMLKNIKASPVPINEAAERANRIQRFKEIVSYVQNFSSALTASQREHPDFQYALKYLEEKALAKLLKKTVDNLIAERCKYYYENSNDGCIQRPLDEIIYVQRDRNTSLFKIGNTELHRTDLSGGTESVMTVRSLASRPSSKLFGTVLLVDEWGDVEQMGEPLYEELGQMNSILATIFIKVENNVTELTTRALN